MRARLFLRACVQRHGPSNWRVDLFRCHIPASQLGLNFMVALTAPLFLRASPSGPYFVCGASTSVVTLVCYLFMPETKSKSLEEDKVLFEKECCEICLERMSVGSGSRSYRDMTSMRL
ncbi:hypothetical protein JVU11DRAFT_3600 [Chiua virens]|nr:hypothetical protein JVU11DRAFT_3600 [Chiua virens]